MEGIWYYRRAGKLTGPIPFGELVEAAATGAFEADDDVRGGHSGWQKANTVPELSAVLGIPVEQTASEHDFAVSDLEALPSIDDFFIDADQPDSTIQNQPESAPPATHQETHYFYRVAGQERGPLSLEELQQLVDSGTIHRHERVRSSDSVAWVPCSEISELDFHRAASVPDPAPEIDEESDDPDFDPNFLDQFEESDPVESSLQKSAPEERAPRETTSTSTAVSTPPAKSVEPVSTPHRESLEPPVRTPPVPPPRPIPFSDPFPAKPEQTGTKPAKTRSFTVPQFSASGAQLIFLALAVGFFVFMYALPKSKSGVYGTVRLGELPLPAGSVTLNSHTKSEYSAVSFSIFDGEFEAGEEVILQPETYDVVIVIGNPLGMAVPQFQGTPFEKLNGARYQTQLDGATHKSGPIEFVIDETKLELFEGSAELPQSGRPK